MTAPAPAVRRRTPSPAPPRGARRRRSPIKLDPLRSAKAAGLRYIDDGSPGIRRRRSGRGFSYTHPDGTRVDDGATLRRIRSLAIPPAWVDVWISPIESGHIQATGRDARHRKQYRYHPRWREVCDENKFARLARFGEVLPRIRERTAADLARPGLPREKVLAAVVSLLEATLIRVGNEEYARANQSYGLTTLRNEHVDVAGHALTFSFRGKSGKEHTVGVRDRRLAGIVRRCQDLPGAVLFQYVDAAGEAQNIGSSDVNDYLREITGEDFSAKDFRTWAGTLIAARELRERDRGESEAQARREMNNAVKLVAHRLGNTPAISRKSYVHPFVFEAFLDGGIPAAPERPNIDGLDPEECAVLRLLERAPAAG